MLTKVLETLLTVGVGLAAAVLLYFVLNALAAALPAVAGERVRPYLFVLPAVVIVAVYLIYPALQTIFYSFANSDSTAIVGLANYKSLFTDPDFRQTLLNTLIWIIVAPAATIALGLVVATLSDKLRPRGEKLSKSLVFMPMAIGAVGSATIWRFVYTANPNVGIQNAVWHGILGFKSIGWVAQQTGHLNTFALIVIFLWGQIGFSMVLLSAAIKGVPVETIEAARIDGANELAIFFRVIVPQIKITIVTVFITVLISTLKIFDIVYVITNGDFNTNVIGLDFYQEQNVNLNHGKAAAIVVILLVAVIPIMVYQVRQFRLQEAAR